MPTDASFAAPKAGAEPRDLFDARQLLHALRRHVWLLLSMAFAVFLAVMVVTLLSRMQFRSVARLYLGELESPNAGTVRAPDHLELSSGSQGVIGSEIEIIQSRSLVSRAALDSGLNVSISRMNEEPPRYWAWLLARRNPLLLDRPAQELRAEGCQLTDPREKDLSYTLRFSSSTEYTVLDAGEQPLGHCKLAQPCRVAGAELRLFPGHAGPPDDGALYSVIVHPLVDVIDGALKALQVTSPRPTPQSPPVNVVTLEFASTSPNRAASFLERLIAAYLAERQAWKVEDAGAAETFVSTQLASVRQSLDDIQQRLATYRSNNRVVVLDAEANAMVEQIGKYETQRVAARLEAAALSDVQRTLQGQNPPAGAFLLGEANDTVLEGMASALSNARQKLTDLQSRFNDAAPEVRDQKSQVDAQLESIRNYVSSRAARARENLGTLDRVIAQYEKRLQSVPGAELGLAQLSRESEVYSRVYSYLLERQQQTAIIKASTLSKNRVLDAPQLPHREDSPRLPLRMASAPLGLLLGALLALGRSHFARALQSSGEARQAAGPLAVLGVIPRRMRRGSRAPDPTDELDGIGDSAWSPFVEAFRTARAKLYLSYVGQTLLITSPGEGDGKTTCALGLAAALAADGKRVIVVDTALRTARADAHMAGLSDILRGEVDWLGALQVTSCPLGSFGFLPAGGPAPAELLSSKAMGGLLEQLRKSYDFVILDSSAFPASADALVLAASSDVVVSVLRVGHTDRRAAAEHFEALSAGAPHGAVVVNDAGEAPPKRLRKPTRRPVELAPSSPRLPLRGRSLAFWIGALLLLTGAAVAHLSTRATRAIQTVVSQRHPG